MLAHLTVDRTDPLVNDGIPHLSHLLEFKVHVGDESRLDLTRVHVQRSVDRRDAIHDGRMIGGPLRHTRDFVAWLTALEKKHYINQSNGENTPAYLKRSQKAQREVRHQGRHSVRSFNFPSKRDCDTEPRACPKRKKWKRDRQECACRREHTLNSVLDSQSFKFD